MFSFFQVIETYIDLTRIILKIVPFKKGLLSFLCHSKIQRRVTIPSALICDLKNIWLRASFIRHIQSNKMFSKLFQLKKYIIIKYYCFLF